MQSSPRGDRIPGKRSFLPGLLIFLSLAFGSAAEETNQFDAAPFAAPLPEGSGLVWEDPREIHQVVARFHGAVPVGARVRLEYWGSHWPAQHWPKDRQPGGGDVGWEEISNSVCRRLRRRGRLRK